MEDTFYYLLAFVLVAVIYPILSRKFKSGKNARDFEFKRRSGKVLDNFDEENSFVDKYSR
jgi:hypothetical protein